MTNQERGPMNEPTMGEILRRLDEQARDYERVLQRVETLTEKLEARYVPRDVFDLRVGEVEKDIATQAAFRRQVAAGALVGLIVIVLNIVVVLTRFPGAS